MRIAIDGPAASGKSSIAKVIGEQYELDYIDTGAMYRAVTYYFESNSIEDITEKELQKLNFRFKQPGNLMILNEQNIEEKIREHSVSSKTSKYAKNKLVREYLGKIQIQMAKKDKVIMDGRDITTVIMPDADYKFYITACVDTRASRRFNQDSSSDIEQIKTDILIRDKSDQEREIGPLLIAKDAIIIDSSKLDLNQTVELIKSYLKV
jgi:cytidylate kinase